MKVTNKEYKRLCYIDDKMLNDKPITESERKERLDIITKMMKVEPI
ncbi:MAG TPA: hypothetical protein VIK78_14610 [Ruminiclostridium sp.]